MTAPSPYSPRPASITRQARNTVSDQPFRPVSTVIDAKDLQSIQAIAESLNIPASALVANDDRLARMIIAFEQLTSAQQEQLLNAIELK
jgi:hypothetical protein